MKYKVERITSDLATKIAQWSEVDTVTLAETVEEDLQDPYFFISLDVYYRGGIPDVDSRMRVFSDAGAFESSSVTSKDRFLIESVPIRIEYKDIARIDEILRKTNENMWVFRQTGTYMFYRLASAKELGAKSEWLESVRGTLDELPEEFWDRLANSSRATMEHYLSDLIAAVMRDDKLFYLISAAGFIKSFLSLLFVLNREFEPSGRMLYEKAWNLPVLPENFKGRFHSFLREDPEFPPSRKREIAELMAKSVIFMR